MSLFCVVTYPIPDKAGTKSESFVTGSIQPYAVGVGRRFLLEDRFKKSVKELFNIIRKTRGVGIGLVDAKAMEFFNNSFEQKAELSLRIDLVQTYDKGKAPPVVEVVATSGPASVHGSNIARLELKKARVANKWRTELGGFHANIDAGQVTLHWVDQSSEAA